MTMRRFSYVLALLLLSAGSGGIPSRLGIAGLRTAESLPTERDAVDSGDIDLQSGADPVLVSDHFVETTLGNPDGVNVSV